MKLKKKTTSVEIKTPIVLKLGYSVQLTSHFLHMEILNISSGKFNKRN